MRESYTFQLGTATHRKRRNRRFQIASHHVRVKLRRGELSVPREPLHGRELCL